MQMNPEDIKTYPRLYQYVSATAPVSQEIVALVGIAAEGGPVPEAIREALVWGQTPSLRVSEGIQSATDNLIFLPQAMVQKFEAGKGLCTLPNGKLVPLIGLAVTHQLGRRVSARGGANDQLMMMMTQLTNSIKDLAAKNNSSDPTMMMMMMMMMGGGGNAGVPAVASPPSITIRTR